MPKRRTTILPLYNMPDKNQISEDFFIYPGRNSTKYNKNINNNYVKPRLSLKQHPNQIAKNTNLKITYIFKKSLNFKSLLRILPAYVILLFSTLLILFFSNTCAQIVNNIQFFDYNKFLYPIVMQNPEPFSENNPPPYYLIMNASIWKAASEKDNSDCNYDETGKILVTLEDAKQACSSLFGDNTKLEPNCESHYKSFYEYNSEKQIFYVDCVSHDQCYMPNTVNAINLGNTILLKVDYVKIGPSDDLEKYPNDDQSTQKHMEYYLKKNINNGKFYVSEIKKI